MAMKWYKIRKANSDDVAQIAELEKLCFPHPWSEADIRKDIAENILATYIVCLEADDNEEKIVAYAGIWNVVDEGHITNVAVHPGHRRRGVATMVVDNLLQVARERGAERFTLEVRRSNRSAIELYEKFGFREVGYRKGYYTAENEDALIMWLIEGDPLASS
jgi:ribosomal-protein-alanine N-acetyltransferase